MSPWRAGLISPHQLSSVGPPRSLFKGRSVCTAPSGTAPGHSSQPPPGTMVCSLCPFAGLQARLGKDSSAGVCHPEAREPDPRYPPGPCASPTSFQSDREAPPVTSGSAGHPEAPLTPQARQPPGAGPCGGLQLSGGPRNAPRPLIPGALTTRGPKGKARPASQAAPHIAPWPHPD
ncbi:hypothetical protein NDU88_007885 [Pleurodeles waltl]|uniref:Uncharacterized protein n=1 Tax=Pleurodeles waltl TaxID=8319 RepID=A0AAV7RW55_PLEWA|nr:hypothetical protein NDU88_007885 [Pleurodeles waltl]